MDQEKISESIQRTLCNAMQGKKQFQMIQNLNFDRFNPWTKIQFVKHTWIIFFEQLSSPKINDLDPELEKQKMLEEWNMIFGISRTKR